MFENYSSFEEISKVHQFNQIQFYEKLLNYYNKHKRIYTKNGKKEYQLCLDVGVLSRILRSELWCKQQVRIKTKTIKDSENDFGVAGWYTTSNNPKKSKKAIELELNLFDNGDGGYWINHYSVSILADEIYDTIEHEIRHWYQDWKSGGKAFNAKSVDYYSKHYEVDAFAQNAIAQTKRNLYRYDINLQTALFDFPTSIINTYKCEVCNEHTVRRLLKKVYKGITQ